MRHELPTSNEIFEELADKVAGQIERGAPVAFDRALREMVKYHRFLLALNASRLPDGAATNYAELSGSNWDAPSNDWIRRYSRLFELAANRIPDEDHFITQLASVPDILLRAPNDIELTPTLIKRVLDLGPLLIHRLESWVTKRTNRDVEENEAAPARLALAGSDAKAYANVLPDLVGRWEGLLNHAFSLFDIANEPTKSPPLYWLKLAKGWFFFWEHLSNTAYCLAVAVWNEDEQGAKYFSEALIRWPDSVEYRFPDRAELRSPSWIYPAILERDWDDASEIVKRNSFEYPEPHPASVFFSLLHLAHEDVLLLTTALLLSWSAGGKQSSDIAARIARTILNREADDDRTSRTDHRKPTFGSLLLSALRIELAADQSTNDGYGDALDGLVSQLDNMTERRVVPGRIFTPSTLRDRGGLFIPILALLLLNSQTSTTETAERISSELANEPDNLPRGDRSLRDALQWLKGCRESIGAAQPELARIWEALAPPAAIDVARENLRVSFDAAISRIEQMREDRLLQLPINPAQLEHIRAAVEVAITRSPAQMQFFGKVPVAKLLRNKSGTLYQSFFDEFEKAKLVSPPMADIANFEGNEAELVRRSALRYALREFFRLPRTAIALEPNLGPFDQAFWASVFLALPDVGPDPALLISRDRKARNALRSITDQELNDRGLIVKSGSPRGGRAGYITSVNGIDMFETDLEADLSLLFSSSSLRSIRYAKFDPNIAKYVSASFVADTNATKGRLAFGFKQSVNWRRPRVFEFRSPRQET